VCSTKKTDDIEDAAPRPPPAAPRGPLFNNSLINVGHRALRRRPRTCTPPWSANRLTIPTSTLETWNALPSCASEGRSKQMKRSALIVTIVPLLVIAYLVYEFAHRPWTPLRTAGFFLMIPALLLLTISRIQLGDSFFGQPAGETTGPPWYLLAHSEPDLCVRYNRFRGPLSFPRTTLSTFASRALTNPADHPCSRRSMRPRTAFRRPVPPIQSHNLVLTSLPGVMCRIS
jgi:hypothetical protein